MEKYDPGMQLATTDSLYIGSTRYSSSKVRPTREDVLLAPLDYRSMIGPENRFALANEQIHVTTSPVTLEKNLEPKLYLNPASIGPPRPPVVIDKRVERIVEVLKEAPVDKVVEAMRERLQVVEKVQERPGTTVYEEHPRIEEKVRHVPFERVVYKEVVQEVVVDKIVDVIVEVVREVVVPRVVERRVEIIQEVPTIRYVDKVITREVPIIRVVERTVEVIKEVPVETIKEVPVYVRADVTAYDERDRAASFGASSLPASGLESQMYSSKRVSVGAERHVMDRRLLTSART